jgi:hypothetical protein
METVQRACRAPGGGSLKAGQWAAAWVGRRVAAKGTGLEGPGGDGGYQMWWRWQAEAEAATTSNYNEVATWGREKRKHPVLNPPMLIDEYMGSYPSVLTPPIFVGGTTSPRNIRALYSSVMWHQRWIYGVGQSQTGRALYSSVASPTNITNIHQFWVPTNIIWNIFIGTDEYIDTDEWMVVSCSVQRQR